MTSSKKIGILTCVSREWILPKSLQEGGSSLSQAMGGQNGQQQETDTTDLQVDLLVTGLFVVCQVEQPPGS